MDKNSSFSKSLLKSAVKNNPVLIQCVGLCPVVAASSNLREAFILAMAIMVDMVISCVIASAIFKKIPRFIRVALYLIIGMGIVCPILWVLETKTLISLSLGMRIYLPLVAVNSVTAVHCETYSVKHTVKESLYDALATSIGVAVIMVLCGAVREIIGKGSLGDYPLNVPFTLNSMAMPFGCLIMLGFFSVILKAIQMRVNSNKDEGEEKPEEVSMEFGETNIAPSTVRLELPNDDEYEYLLASVDELIASFDDKDGGEGK